MYTEVASLLTSSKDMIICTKYWAKHKINDVSLVVGIKVPGLAKFSIEECSTGAFVDLCI